MKNSKHCPDHQIYHNFQDICIPELDPQENGTCFFPKNDVGSWPAAMFVLYSQQSFCKEMTGRPNQQEQMLCSWIFTTNRIFLFKKQNKKLLLHSSYCSLLATIPFSMQKLGIESFGRAFFVMISHWCLLPCDGASGWFKEWSGRSDCDWLTAFECYGSAVTKSVTYKCWLGCF